MASVRHRPASRRHDPPARGSSDGGGAAAAAPAFAADVACPPSPSLDIDLKLPHLAGLFAARRPVRIVAIGALSTAGNPANGTLGRAYPDRLKEALVRRVGPMDITVLNKASPARSAAAQLARFPTDVYANKPDLVIWETGTNDAVAGIDRDVFAAEIQDGIDDCGRTTSKSS